MNIEDYTKYLLKRARMLDSKEAWAGRVLNAKKFFEFQKTRSLGDMELDQWNALYSESLPGFSNLEIRDKETNELLDEQWLIRKTQDYANS